MISRFGKWMATVMTAGLVAACAGERPTNLGVRDGRLRACPDSPNCVSSFATDDRHRIEPLTFTGEAETAFALLGRILQNRPDAVLIEQSPTYLRVELRTRLFVDDGEFLLDAAQRQIHVRSASRLGYSDLGKNRSRMESIRAAFRQAMAASASRATATSGDQGPGQ